MSRPLTRRQAIAAGSAAAAMLVLPMLPAPRPARGPASFVYDASLDPQGRIAAMIAPGEWAMVPVAAHAELLIGWLDGAADLPARLGGLTSPGLRFIFEQVAHRRGLRRIAAPGPVWMLAGEAVS